jgi:hypothetical protein
MVHREVIPSSCRKRIERLRNLHSIGYTDGTSLILTLREAEPGERVKQIDGYSSLIRQAEAREGSRVLVVDIAE